MPPVLVLVSDRDIQNRLEQITLFRSTLKHFNCPEEKIKYKLMEGYNHTQYLDEKDEQGDNVFANIVIRFIEETE